MTTENHPIDPYLTDIFRTALRRENPTADEAKSPSVVVHGDHNIISWGGTIHVSAGVPPNTGASH